MPTNPNVDRTNAPDYAKNFQESTWGGKMFEKAQEENREMDKAAAEQKKQEEELAAKAAKEQRALKLQTKLAGLTGKLENFRATIETLKRAGAEKKRLAEGEATVSAKAALTETQRQEWVRQAEEKIAQIESVAKSTVAEQAKKPRVEGLPEDMQTHEVFDLDTVLEAYEGDEKNVAESLKTIDELKDKKELSPEEYVKFEGAVRNMEIVLAKSELSEIEEISGPDLSKMGAEIAGFMKQRSQDESKIARMKEAVIGAYFGGEASNIFDAYTPEEQRRILKHPVWDSLAKGTFQGSPDRMAQRIKEGLDLATKAIEQARRNKIG